MIWGARARVLRDQPLGDHQPLLQVGEGLAHVPAHLREARGCELPGARREADHEEVVARKARAHQVIDRQSDALGGAGKRPAQDIDQLMSSSRTVVVWVS